METFRSKKIDWLADKNVDACSKWCSWSMCGDCDPPALQMQPNDSWLTFRCRTINFTPTSVGKIGGGCTSLVFFLNRRSLGFLNCCTGQSPGIGKLHSFPHSTANLFVPNISSIKRPITHDTAFWMNQLDDFISFTEIWWTWNVDIICCACLRPERAAYFGMQVSCTHSLRP